LSRLLSASTAADCAAAVSEARRSDAAALAQNASRSLPWSPVRGVPAVRMRSTPTATFSTFS